MKSHRQQLKEKQDAERELLGELLDLFKAYGRKCTEDNRCYECGLENDSDSGDWICTDCREAEDKEIDE